MALDPLDRVPVLLVRAGLRLCAFPVDSVVETMRPLPTERVPGLPAFLLGLSVIRGAPVPVVDLNALFEGTESCEARRFVVIRMRERRSAVAVESVVGLRSLDRSLLQTLPALVRDAHPDVIAAIGIQDQNFLLVLHATRLIPEGAWRALEASEVAT